MAQGFNLKENHSLLPHNTFGIEAKARWFVEYQTTDELIAALAYRAAHFPTLPLLHIGGGSNLLFLNDYPGLVLKSALKSIHIISTDETNCFVQVGAGVIWDEWVEYTLAHDWYGLENLSGIPGQVGAAAVQNIGAYGVEAREFVYEVTCLNLAEGSIYTFSVQECGYGYRQSIFKNELAGRYAVLSVTFKLTKCFSPKLAYRGLTQHFSQRGIDPHSLSADDMRSAVLAIRNSKLPDPAKMGNAGSFFMNPIVSLSAFETLRKQYPAIPSFEVDSQNVKIPAAWLIEQCGWKGRSLGRAAVHNKQPLVLVNLGGASGAEIQTLSTAIQDDVLHKFGIALKTEALIIEN